MKMKLMVMAISAALASAGASAKDEVVEPEFKWSIETGLGYETNAFHAPDHDYADYYADPTGLTIVAPEEQAGFFIPLKVKTEMTNAMSKATDLVASYRFSGYIYPDSALNDANSTDHEVNLGAETVLGKKGKKGKAYAGIFVRSHDKVYVDRDTGTPKDSSLGLDVSNRYSYQSFGVEGKYERKLSRANTVGVEATYESLDYDKPDAWSEYDHTYTMLGAYWEHDLAKRTKLTLGVTSKTRDYEFRSSYDINGALVGPQLVYSYMGYDVTLRHRFNDNTVAYFDYEVVQRSDNNVGYNDMDQSKVKLRLVHDLNETMRLRARVGFTDRDYANAYNFEDPTQGSKSASGVDVQLRGEYSRSDNKLYYVELEQNSRDNTDDRYQYNNTVLMMGAKWEF